jgi:predicted amidohydrolase YtcJ
VLRQTAAVGVTTLRVCGLGTLTGADDLDLMRAVMENAAPLRLRATLDSALLPAWTDLQLAPGFGDDFFRADTLSSWLGDEPSAVYQLAASIRAARAAGWGVTVHAADDAEFRNVLTAFEASGAAFGRAGGIECRYMPPRHDIAAMHHLGLSLGLTNSEHVAATTDNVPLSLGLDAATGPSAPLRMIANAVAGEPGLRLTPMQALAAVTINAARRCGVADSLGSLERGKYADFVFLDRDPSTVPPADLASLQCCATWMNGREMFRASSATASSESRIPHHPSRPTASAT